MDHDYGSIIEIHSDHYRQGVPDMYIRLVKDMYHQCEIVERCAAGTSDPFAMDAGLHQG